MSALWFFLVIILFYSAIKRPYKKISTEEKPINDDAFFKNVLKSGQDEDIKMFYELRKISNYTRFLKNVRLPMENKTISKVDLIMISQKGIYLFDAKDITGLVYGDEINKYWTYINFADKKKRIENPIWYTKAYLNILKRVLYLYEPEFYRIMVVFGEGSTIKKMNIKTPLIRVLHKKEVLLKVREEMLRSKNIFSAEGVDKIHDKLEKFAETILVPSVDKVEEEETNRNGLILIRGKKK